LFAENKKLKFQNAFSKNDALSRRGLNHAAQKIFFRTNFKKMIFRDLIREKTARQLLELLFAALV
jgi:hypothetical protein